MNIFNIAEIAVRFFPFLSTVDRARNRLTTPTFNFIYNIEEKKDLIDKWQKYVDELGYDNESPILSNDQLDNLINQFGFSNMQFHLKIWLTYCSSGRYNFNDLVSIGPVDDWEFLVDTPISDHSNFKLLLESEFGQDEWQENLILVMNGHDRKTFLDKRNGVFYFLAGQHYSSSLKSYGNIKDWIDNIPLHIIRPISLIGHNSYPSMEMIEAMRNYVKIMEEGNIDQLLEFLKVNGNFYEYLCEELKRDERVLDAVKVNFENIDCQFINIPAFIPIDIRKDREAYFDLFKIRNAHLFLHHSLRKDKEFTMELLKSYSSDYIEPLCIETKFINDPDVASLFNFHFDLAESGFKIKTKEILLKLWYFNPKVNDIDPELLNNLPLMVEIINEIFTRDYKPDEYLQDEELIKEEVSNRNVIFLSITSPELRNNYEFMSQCIEMNESSVIFIGESLKSDIRIVNNETAWKHISGLKLTKEEIIEIMYNMDQDDIDYLICYKSIKNTVPNEYLQDEDFMMKLLEISVHTHALLSKKLRKDMNFWRKAIKLNDDLLTYGVIPLELIKEMYDTLNFANIDTRLLSEEMRSYKRIFENSSEHTWPYMYNCASETIRSDKELLLKCMDSDITSYLYAPPQLKQDNEVKQRLRSEYAHLELLPNKLPSKFSE